MKENEGQQAVKPSYTRDVVVAQQRNSSCDVRRLAGVVSGQSMIPIIGFANVYGGIGATQHIDHPMHADDDVIVGRAMSILTLLDVREKWR